MHTFYPTRPFRHPVTILREETHFESEDFCNSAYYKSHFCVEVLLTKSFDLASTLCDNTRKTAYDDLAKYSFKMNVMYGM